VIKSLAAPTLRIALAIVLSILLHGLVLWLPEVKLPEHEISLPPLIAKLEPLPKLSVKVGAHKTKKPHPKPKPVAPVPAAENIPVPVSAPSAAEEVAASAPAVTEEPAASAPVATEAAEPPRPPLPKHARLHFNVYQGQGNFKIGESQHELEVVDGHYTIKASVHTTGLVSVLKSYRMVQTSSGTATAQTLKPETFTEEITDSSGTQSSRAEFDWANATLHFSQGGEAKLPAHSQDILSILYQFPPMREQEDSVVIHIGTGKKFEEYTFEILFEEALETPMGTLQTVHFSKRHAANEEGLEIWFAQEYRLLPVKMRHIDRSGKIAGEAIITDIRVSDE
jgi:hypothetical protein